MHTPAVRKQREREGERERKRERERGIIKVQAEKMI